MRLIDGNELMDKVNKIPYLRKLKAQMLINECTSYEAIPIPFIKLQKDVLRSLIECSDMSSKELFALSKKHEALEELLKDWSEHESEA